MWGLVGRANAKCCPQIGLTKQQLLAYHKNFLNKVMVLAMTGYAFEEHQENGGHGIRIGLWRIQAARIAKQQQREGPKTKDGRQVFDGPIIRQKGDVYMVDRNVTGSNEGTSDAPNFSLSSFFKEVVFPHLAAIVGPGGLYEDFIPVVQGDKAGRPPYRQSLRNHLQRLLRAGRLAVGATSATDATQQRSRSRRFPFHVQGSLRLVATAQWEIRRLKGGDLGQGGRSVERADLGEDRKSPHPRLSHREASHQGKGVEQVSVRQRTSPIRP